MSELLRQLSERPQGFTRWSSMSWHKHVSSNLVNYSKQTDQVKVGKPQEEKRWEKQQKMMKVLNRKLKRLTRLSCQVEMSLFTYRFDACFTFQSTARCVVQWKWFNSINNSVSWLWLKAIEANDRVDVKRALNSPSWWRSAFGVIFHMIRFTLVNVFTLRFLTFVIRVLIVHNLLQHLDLQHVSCLTRGTRGSLLMLNRVCTFVQIYFILLSKQEREIWEFLVVVVFYYYRLTFSHSKSHEETGPTKGKSHWLITQAMSVMLIFNTQIEM